MPSAGYSCHHTMKKVFRGGVAVRKFILPCKLDRHKQLRVQCFAKGHFNIRTGRTEDQTVNLRVTEQPLNP